MTKILIFGGVAGGATAAARLRRLNEKDEIIMFERDECISFANCGLPYYIGDVITDRNKLFVQTVPGMTKRFGLDIRNFSEVVAIDKANKKVTVKDIKKDELYEETFDKLIISTGAKPIRPRIEGIDEAKNVFVLRNIPDTDAIKTYITANNIKTATVIGGGFIGVEMAENLAETGVNVHLIEMMPQVLAPFDFEMAQIIHSELNLHGINLNLGDGLARFEAGGDAIVLQSGKRIETEMTILSIGVAPESTIAKNAGMALNPRGFIKTGDSFNVIDDKTGEENPDIYAIGDVIEVSDFVTGEKTSVPLAWGANRQGRLVADHIGGLKIGSSRIQGTAAVKVFDMTAAVTGKNEAYLKAAGIPYTAVHAHRANHASYYPGPSNIALKLLFDQESGRILGAQAVGKEGTDKRIDVIATAMKLNATVEDLADLELCYAPPYSSAKDPVNILGYIASNVRQGVYKVVHWNEIDDIIEKGGYLLDVRTPVEFSTGHIDGSVNIEVDDLRNRLSEINLPKDAPVYITCQVGLRGYIAAKILAGNGYTNLHNLSGGYSTYKTGNYMINKPITAARATEADDSQKLKTTAEITEIDVSGLQCPGPLMSMYKAVSAAKEGERVRIISTEAGFASDAENWCKTNGHTLVSLMSEGGRYIATIEKGKEQPHTECLAGAGAHRNATMVVFSGELDKVLASLIIAQGAVAQGKKVTMFFTFWGLNALRKPDKVKVNKNATEKMFGTMMPRGAGKLPLSNMNMLGMGKSMIEGIMKKKNVDDLPTMLKKAQEMGVRFIACTMSMDLMGIKPEELIDDIEYAGVASYIAANEDAGTTLFI
jgi:NADPH-dependent 2,4-dienoyl-CoA reductase/sulfur reductase-like enzyme/peroxiredoxin family protein/rhodanese-related sulfurtransferase/TusA-related sulfurtransferase